MIQTSTPSRRSRVQTIHAFTKPAPENSGRHLMSRAWGCCPGAEKRRERPSNEVLACWPQTARKGTSLSLSFAATGHSKGLTRIPGIREQCRLEGLANVGASVLGILSLGVTQPIRASKTIRLYRVQSQKCDCISGLGVLFQPDQCLEADRRSSRSLLTFS